MQVKVYKMLGASPAPDTDYYLGDAVNLGGGTYTFNLPPTTSDYQFYYYGIDEAGNAAYSNVEYYLDATNALAYRTTTGLEFAGHKGDGYGLIKLRGV